MRHLPLVTLTLWLLTALLYYANRSFFAADHVQFPLIIILSLLLPASFWLLCQQQRRRAAAFFVALFMTNVSMYAHSLWEFTQIMDALSTEQTGAIDPVLLDQLSTGTTERDRRVSARLVYRTVGVALAYKKDGAAYTLFTPDEGDFRQFNRRRMEHADREQLQRQARLQRSSILLALTLQIALFLFLLIYLVFRSAPHPAVRQSRRQAAPGNPPGPE